MATSRIRLPLVITLGLPVSVLIGLACARSQPPVAASPSGATPAGAAPVAAPAPDSLQASRDRMLGFVRRSIAGREQQPAESVFNNIKVMRGMPAGRLLSIMDVGFSRGLGVSCDHCHTPGRWATDDKAPKRIARGMMGMVRAINTEYLGKISDLADRKPAPVVNCTTCHRGMLKPALNIPSQMTGSAGG